MRPLRTCALLVGLLACGKPAAAPAPAPEPAPARPIGPIDVGARITPITEPVAIPVKGAKLTMVSYFATWCGSSIRWIAPVEAMRKKYPGLAVIGVANYDEASPAELEAFVRERGGTYPVTADPGGRILHVLPPRGWGQQIIVLDDRGVVRLVHRGTREGDFESVDAAIGRLLADAR